MFFPEFHFHLIPGNTILISHWKDKQSQTKFLERTVHATSNQTASQTNSEVGPRRNARAAVSGCGQISNRSPSIDGPLRAESDCQTEYADDYSLSGCGAPVQCSAAVRGVSQVLGVSIKGSVVPFWMEGTDEDASGSFLFSFSPNCRLTMCQSAFVLVRHGNSPLNIKSTKKCQKCVMT